MIWLLASMLSSPAMAEPYMDPAAGRLRIDAVGSVSARAVRDADCSGSACSGRWDRSSAGVEIGGAAFRGVGFSGSITRARDSVEEASYKGASTLYGGAMHLAASLHRSLGFAVEARMANGAGTVNQSIPDPGTSVESEHSIALFGTAGDPANGGLLWLGAEALFQSERMLRPMGTEGVSVDLPMVPALPGSVILGATLFSGRVGSPWGRSPRLRTSVEARIGADTGVSLGLGAAW